MTSGHLSVYLEVPSGPHQQSTSSLEEGVTVRGDARKSSARSYVSPRYLVLEKVGHVE